VQVHYGEGLAIHTGPEPCVGTREGVGEASVGEPTGQPLSRESKIVPGAHVVRITEGNMDGRVIASARPTRRGRRPWHVEKFLVREPGDLGLGLRLDTVGPHRKDEES
jgi:hypothetical protein